MKSIEVRFSEALAALRKAGRTKQFDEKAKDCTTIEAKLHAAEAVLKDAGVVRESWPVRKHNGAGDNFVENNTFNRVEEFRESGNSFSPGYIQDAKNITAKSDRLLFDGLLKVGGLTEAEHSKLTGKKPEGYDKLTEQKRKDFDFARAVGLSESDAFKLVEITGNTFKEVSRR